jgi:hypothetical protein
MFVARVGLFFSNLKLLKGAFSLVQDLSSFLRADILQISIIRHWAVKSPPSDYCTAWGTDFPAGKNPV